MVEDNFFGDCLVCFYNRWQVEDISAVAGTGGGDRGSGHINAAIALRLEAIEDLGILREIRLRLGNRGPSDTETDHILIFDKRYMTPQTIIILVLIGIFAGIASGFIGVGGGIIIVPALVYILGLTQHEAQGTSLLLNEQNLAYEQFGSHRLKLLLKRLTVRHNGRLTAWAWTGELGCVRVIRLLPNEVSNDEMHHRY